MKSCTYKDCDRPISPKAAGGLCNAHYHRRRRGTDMDKPFQNRGVGWVSTHGYRYLGKRAEHRLIAETIMGRKLGYNEVVHHIDGNSLNNDPSNICVMSRGDHGRLHCTGKTNEERKAGKP